MKTLNSILIKSASNSIHEFKKSNCFQAGENGPHKHKDTSVRNTAHWILTNLKAYQISNDVKYLDVAKKGLKYLHSNDARPFSRTFLQRVEGGTDRCNGVIGQAWVIEALITSYNVIDDLDSLNLAIDSFKILPFDKHIGLWKRIEVDGKNIGFDLTLNHQIWFAAAGSYIAKYDKEIKHQVDIFLSKLLDKIILHEDGCFKMPVSSNNLLRNGYIFSAIRTSENYKKLRRSKKIGKMVDIGYHAFHLYGLAMLRENYPNHPIWESRIIEESLRYLLNDSYMLDVEKSKYGLGYNPPGFEVAYVLQNFGDIVSELSNEKIDEIIVKWLKYQVDKTFNWETGFMDKVNDDPITYAARIYEVTRLDNKYLLACL